MIGSGIYPHLMSVRAQSFEDVSPAVSAGTAAFGTLLAGRFAADQATVQGIDLLKLHEATLNFIARKNFGTTSAELQAVVDSAKVPRPLRVKQSEPPKPEAQKKEKDGKQ